MEHLNIVSVSLTHFIETVRRRPGFYNKWKFLELLNDKKLLKEGIYYLNILSNSALGNIFNFLNCFSRFAFWESISSSPEVIKPDEVCKASAII